MPKKKPQQQNQSRPQVPKKPAPGPIERYVTSGAAGQKAPQMSGLNFGGRDCCS